MTQKRFNKLRQTLFTRIYHLDPQNREQSPNFCKSLYRLPRPRFSKEYPSYEAMWGALKPVRDLVGM